MARDHSELNSTLERFQLSPEAYNQPISDIHLQMIASSRAIKWKFLPAVLEMANPTVVLSDIGGEGGRPPDQMRADFFGRWQSEKGSDASYKNLVNALLQINCKQDAEYVCELLLSTSSTTLKHPEG